MAQSDKCELLQHEELHEELRCELCGVGVALHLGWCENPKCPLNKYDFCELCFSPLNDGGYCSSESCVMGLNAMEYVC
jgi:hypothetical protein